MLQPFVFVYSNDSFWAQFFLSSSAAEDNKYCFKRRHWIYPFSEGIRPLDTIVVQQNVPWTTYETLKSFNPANKNEYISIHLRSGDAMSRVASRDICVRLFIGRYLESRPNWTTSCWSCKKSSFIFYGFAVSHVDLFRKIIENRTTWNQCLN